MSITGRINSIKSAREQNRKISLVTCYDYTFAGILQETEVDALLVGDSAGMVFAGYGSPVPVTVDEIIYHAGAVRRGAPLKPVIADLPFMSYQVSPEDAVSNAGRILKETGADAVLLEGGAAYRKTVEKLVTASIPVLSHLGIQGTLQSCSGNGTSVLDSQQRRVFLEEARILEEAGALAIILCLLPEDLAEEITGAVSIPTIGFRSGKRCNGEVLIMHEILGLTGTVSEGRSYTSLREASLNAFAEFDRDVKGQSSIS
jgi:3-methyl-2-oxobutanoate hydroxymethyltransferase